MDVRQLRSFIKIAEVGSLSEAANRLRVAQPALSRQIKLLEGELGVALFFRHKRGMGLTNAGELLLARATAILREVDETPAYLRASAPRVFGSITIAFPPTITEILTGRLVQSFVNLSPDVSLRRLSAGTGYINEWMEKGTVDVSILYNPIAATKHRIDPLISEELCFVRLPEPQAPSRPSISLAEIAREPLILCSPMHDSRRLIEQEAARTGIRLNVQIEADSLQVLRDLAMRGIGKTILPVSALRYDIANGKLEAVPIVSPALRRRLVIAIPSNKPTTNATNCLLDVIRDEVRGLVRSGEWKGTMLSSID